MTRILGFDPGTVKVGWAILDGDVLVKSGTFKMAGDLDDRLRQLWKHLGSLTGFFDVAGVEMPPGQVRGRRRDTGLKIGMSIGVIKAFAFSRGLPVLGIHHATCKRLISGNGRASKVRVQEAAMLRFGLSEVEENEADAIAVCVAAQGLWEAVTT